MFVIIHRPLQQQLLNDGAKEITELEYNAAIIDSALWLGMKELPETKEGYLFKFDGKYYFLDLGGEFDD